MSTKSSKSTTSRFQRLNPRHQDLVRAKIQASQLINRLQKHALGKLGMDASQIAAAKILLDKTIPNLHSTELKAGGGLKLEVNLVGVDRSTHG